MRLIKRIALLVSFVLIYLIIKEVLEFYIIVNSIHPILGYIVLITLAAVIIYFIIIPAYKVFRMPSYYGPVADKSEIDKMLRRRIDNFRNNNYLLQAGVDFNTIKYDEDSYRNIIKLFDAEVDKIRRKYVLALFASSSIARNGLIDAVLILSSSINLIKEIFILYNGRVSNRDLFTIGKKVYYSMAIGGSEIVEIASGEVLSLFTAKGLEGVPVAGKILTSMTDGFVNAALLTRVSFITENYCKLLYIESEKDLYPSALFIINTVKHILGSLTSSITKTLKNMPKVIADKGEEYTKLCLNPAAYVLSKSASVATDVASGTKSLLQEGIIYAASPFVYVLSKSSDVLKRKKIT